MRRFITYLYEYEKGQKTKNTGFIRVDERNGKTVFQISVRNYIRPQEKGKIYVFVWENGLHGIEVGSLTILNSQTDVRLELESNNIKDTGYNLDCVVGIGLTFPNNGYMASCWDDTYAEVIGNGRFREWGGNTNSKEADSLKEVRTQVEETKPEATSYDLVVYQKMELNTIKNLPSPNWYLCNNRFLVHGFFNYGYLILKKTSEADGEKTYLGVPGIYEKPEMVMATLFGFPEFQTLPKEIREAKMEEIITMSGLSQQKGQEAKQGELGCWFIPVQR